MSMTMTSTTTDTPERMNPPDGVNAPPAHTPNPVPNLTTLFSTTTSGHPMAPECDKLEIDYTIALAIICAMCFVFGILYTFFGYRFFKATMFLTGFIFGSVLTYLICLEEELLPLEGKVGVALAAGFLCGLITMLVQYVGLFMTGLHLGLLAGVGALVIMEQFYTPSTKWITIGVLFGSGLLCAIFNLYFQKGLTILATAIFGSALMAAAVDYYVEMLVMVRYVWDRVRVEDDHRVCWYSWILLSLWPTLFLIGVIIQWRVTGKGFDHNEAVQHRKNRKVNLERIRAKDNRRGDSQQSRYRHLYQVRRSNGDVIARTGDAEAGAVIKEMSEAPPVPGTMHSRYRHFYQIRRSNGDVISRNYIQNMRQNLSPAMRSLTGMTEDGDSQTQLAQVP